MYCYADVAWLLATGIETATTDAMVSSHPYRMTMVATRRGDHWSLVQVHGSSPHHDQPAEPPGKPHHVNPIHRSRQLLYEPSTRPSATPAAVRAAADRTLPR